MATARAVTPGFNGSLSDVLPLVPVIVTGSVETANKAVNPVGVTLLGVVRGVTGWVGVIALTEPPGTALDERLGATAPVRPTLRGAARPGGNVGRNAGNSVSPHHRGLLRRPPDVRHGRNAGSNAHRRGSSAAPAAVLPHPPRRHVESVGQNGASSGRSRGASDLVVSMSPTEATARGWFLWHVIRSVSSSANRRGSSDARNASSSGRSAGSQVLPRSLDARRCRFPTVRSQ
jgi:hypothetical protein